jgi:autotransporter strand-loop-strand O-heptosyltransferase
MTLEEIISKNGKFKKSYIFYINKKYTEIVTKSIKSIRQYSNIPILVYTIDFSHQFEFENVYSVKWDAKISDSSEDTHITVGDNSYIDRGNYYIYKLLINRPVITKDALENYSEVVAYIDTDNIATPYVDTIFDMYDSNLSYPYFVESVDDWMHINGRGGAMSRDDLSTTLEHPACELFGVNQYIRERYRQTCFYVAGQNTIPFLEEWHSMCIHPEVYNNFEKYAPFHEETLVNVLLWKHEKLDGLPYLYANGGPDVVDIMYSEVEFKGPNVRNYVRPWLRAPQDKKTLLFFHGEKNLDKLDLMIEKIKNYNKTKILFLAPHLSTGGMPSFILKRIESLLEFGKDKYEIFVVEYTNLSPHFVVQKNRIKELLPESNFFTLGENKFELIDIIKSNNIDIVHLDEMIEDFNPFNPMPHSLMNEIYSNNRTWRVIETCHNVVFNPVLSKIYNPDAYAYCTPFHKEKTFKSMPSPGEVIEFPIENFKLTAKDKEKNKSLLGLDPTKIHVVNVGLWTPGKNQGEGVEIARLFENDHPEYQFHFVGNQASNFSSYWAPIMNNLPSNVKVWGERNDVTTFLKSADIFMFNSTWECNPLVLREAASYGLKIISRNLPQYMNMFTPYINVINNDIKKTKEIILSLKNKRVKRHLSENTTKNFYESHMNLYDKVLNMFIRKNDKREVKVSVEQHFVGNPFLEIKGNSDKKYLVEFYDGNDKLIYSNEISSNSWIKLNRQYYTQWRTTVKEDGVVIYDNTLDFEGKKVYIAFDSSSLGDTIAWIPYCLEFKKKHNCEVVVSTFKNDLFKDVYPELQFVTPGTQVKGIYGMYKLGWFYNENSEPAPPNTIPLQMSASNILGLDYTEIKPRISFSPTKRPYKDKYVTIAPNSTAGCKHWTESGWQELVDYLTSKGYKVINVSKEISSFNNVTQITDNSLKNTMNVIHHSEFFIGLSSGLSWLSWVLNKHVVMISNFTEPDHEFTSNCTRIIKKSVCSGCWNNPNFRFDKGDWNWCPIFKNTKRHFECHKSITSDDVISNIQDLLK